MGPWYVGVMNDDSGRPVDAPTAQAARRRRLVLGCLPEPESVVSFDALADAVVRHERQFAGDVVRENVVASLHHVHLPTLDAAGFVDYDEDRRRVEVHERHDSVQTATDDWSPG